MGKKPKKTSAKAALKNALEAKSFHDEIESDQENLKILFERANNKDTSKEEKKSTALLKRALVLIGAGGLKITDNDKKQTDGADNNLPVSSYLSHGSRVMIEIPPNTDNKLINWLTSGSKDLDERSRKYSGDDAYKEKKIVYSRRGATHKVIMNEDKKGTTTLEEKKGMLIGAKSTVKSLFTETNHLGVDLAMGVKLDEENFTKPDGEHGHLYIYYNPPTETKPGSMLIGIERGSPSSGKHSKFGKSGKVSAAGGSKFNALEKKLVETKKNNNDIESYNSNTSKYKDTIIPQKFNGMNVKLTTDSLEKIIQIDANTFKENLISALPGKDLKDFENKIKTTKIPKKIPKQIPQIYKDDIESSISTDNSYQDIELSISTDDITTQKIAKQDSPDGIIQISSDEFKGLDEFRNKNRHQICIEETQIGPKETYSSIPIDDITTEQNGKDQKVVKTTNRMIKLFTGLKSPLLKFRNRNNSKKTEKINRSNSNGGRLH
jgi:hypothetical protein